MKFARGDKAVAECMRSGQKMLYRDLVEDGHIPGLLVHPDWWEPKHPQETPPDVTDPVALYRPSPEISIPAGEGNPLDPDPDEEPNVLYVENTTTAANMVVGSSIVILDEPRTYRFGDPIYVQRGDASWFVSKAATDANVPSFVIYLATPYAGGASLVGSAVYITETGSGVPL